MPDRCEPPTNTPAGVVCILSCEGDTPDDADRIEFPARWNGEMWETKGASAISVRKADLCGWRFVRVRGESEQ